MNTRPPFTLVFKRQGWRLLSATVLLAGCARHADELHRAARAEYAPLVQLQAEYGTLITVGNHPTPDQNGTGERLGLFRDPSGRIWGLPLIVGSNGEILGCAPPGLKDAQVTDTIPSGWNIVGAMNAPTGWRGGTGKLELLLRDPHGEIRLQAVTGSEIAAGPVCWAPKLPGPSQKLYYYLVAPATSAE